MRRTSKKFLVTAAGVYRMGVGRISRAPCRLICARSADEAIETYCRKVKQKFAPGVVIEGARVVPTKRTS